MYLVFNVGGTNTRVAVSHDATTLKNIKVVSTPITATEGCRFILNLANELGGGEKVEMIGGGIAGVWNKERNMLIRSPNLPGWEGRIKLPNAVLENDAAVEALGEATIGSGRRKSIVAYLCVGTGIGGCRIINGKIDERTTGFEPGQMIINWGKRTGYLEDFASGKAIEKIWGKQGEKMDKKEVWENEARLLSIAIHNLIVMWSPEIVILGGSVIKSVNIELIKKYLKEELKIFPEIPEIVKAELGEKSGLYGALELIRQKLGRNTDR